MGLGLLKMEMYINIIIYDFVSRIVHQGVPGSAFIAI